MADGFTVDTVGLEVVDAMLGRMGAVVLGDGGRALEREMANVLAESQDLVPYLTGALHDSGYVSDPFYGADEVAITIGYGGENGEVPYALEQHEDLDYTHAEGKEAKYLEKPLLEWTKTGPQVVGIHIFAGLRNP